MTITVNAAEIHRLANRLERLNRRGIPFAKIETINRAAFGTQRDARRGLADRMILRNPWTIRSIRVRKATLRTMEAATGSTERYMEVQEVGGIETASGAHGVVIPTTVASGEGRGVRPRKRLVRRPNRVSRIKLSQRIRTSSRKQRNVVAVREAIRTNRRFIFLDLQRSKGIFRVFGGKRNPRVEMIHDLSRPSVTTPRNPWLMPAARGQTQQLTRYYATALERQLARLR